MSEFNQVSSGIWLNKKIRSLSPKSKLVYIYLCCNFRVAVSGIYHVNPEFISFEIGGVSTQEVNDCLLELEHRNLISFDRNKDLVWVIGKIDFEKSHKSTDNRYKKILKQLSLSRGSTFFDRFFQVYPQFIDFEVIVEEREKKFLEDKRSSKE